MARGRMNTRTSESTGKTRLRFYGAAPEQVETILLALEIARHELRTEYDTVALEAICLSYLAGEKIRVRPPSV